MCREMIREDAPKKRLKVPLSNDTVSRRISEMASDIQNQVLERMKGSPFFSIQLDESTDVSNAALLLVFVRYLWIGILQEDMLFCGATNSNHCPGMLGAMHSYTLWSAILGISTTVAAREIPKSRSGRMPVPC